MLPLRCALVCALAAAACAEQQPVPAAPVAVSEPEPPERPPPIAGDELVAARQERPEPGTPHAGFIDAIALSHDGEAALTRDSEGGVRLWAALDGSVEPRAVAVRGARGMSLARAGDELVAAVVDSADALRVWRYAGGELVELGASGELSVMQAEVLPGGEHLAVLGHDRVVRLRDLDGAERGRLERRRFRPGRLYVDDTGDLWAETAEADPTDGTSAVGLLRIAVEPGKVPALRPAPDPHLAACAIGPGVPRALAPDAKHLACVRADKPEGPWSVVVHRLADGTTTEVASDLPATNGLTLRFAEPEQLMVVAATDAARHHASGPTRLTWRADLESGDLVPETLPSGTATGLRAGVRVVGYNAWLYVRRDGEEGRYLGYAGFQPHGAAVSPAGGSVAWVGGGVVYVEPVDGDGPRLRLTGSFQSVPAHVAFVDEEHLAVVDTAGGVLMVRADSGEALHRIDGGGPADHIDGDPEQGLLLLGRFGNSTLLEVDAVNGFRGPYPIPDGASFAGLLDAELAGGDVVWTRGQQFRTYRLDELRAGVSRRSIEERATSPEAPAGSSGNGWPAAVARDGTGFYGGYEVNRVVVRLHDRADPIGPVNGALRHVRPSPDGRLLALVSTESLTVFDRGSGDELWSYGRINDAFWSPDGTGLVVVTHGGGALLGADDGQRRHGTCGPWFEVRQTPPPAAIVPVAPSMCQ